MDLPAHEKGQSENEKDNVSVTSDSRSPAAAGNNDNDNNNNNDSDECRSLDEEKILEKQGLTANNEPQYSNNFFPSITKRCRARMEWANQLDYPPIDDRDSPWVCRKENCNQEICKKFLEYIKAQENLQESAAALSQAQAELAQGQAELAQHGQSSDVVRRLLENEVKYKQNAMKLLENAVKDKQNAVNDKKYILKEGCFIINNCHENTKDIIFPGKDAGNKTDYQTGQTNRSELNKEAKRLDEQEKISAPMQRNQTHAAESPSTLMKIITNAGEHKRLGGYDNIQDGTKKNLKAFYDFCNEMFGKAVQVPKKHKYESQGFIDCIGETCTIIVTWDEMTTVAKDKVYYRPSAIAQETKAVQPIMFALVWKINDILGGHGHLSKEAFFPQTLGKTKRWMDGMWSTFVQQRLVFADGNLMRKSLEIKPLSRKNESFSKLLQSGKNQILGHTMQTLWDSFFHYGGGLGRDGQSSGVVLTMASVQILTSILSNVGTRDVAVSVEETKILPLFSRKTTQNLFTESKQELMECGLEFCPEGMADVSDGFKALVLFVKDPPHGEDKRVICEISNPGGGERLMIDTQMYLGSGAYSTVYAVLVSGRRSDEFTVTMKVAKSSNQSVHALENELAALKALEHKSIPKLQLDCIADLKVSERCEFGKSKCLLFKQRKGVTARELLPTTVEMILQIFHQVNSALDYAHKQGWCHLDVQPSNIIVVQHPIKNMNDQKDDLGVFLIDWGCAMPVQSKMKNYRGTPLFSHPDLLLTDKDKWKARQVKESFDKFSLTLTVCYMLKGKMPWDGFGAVRITKEALSERARVAKDLIHASHLEMQELIDFLRQAKDPKLKELAVFVPENPPSKRRRIRSSNHHH